MIVNFQFCCFGYNDSMILFSGFSFWFYTRYFDKFILPWILNLIWQSVSLQQFGARIYNGIFIYANFNVCHVQIRSFSESVLSYFCVFFCNPICNEFLLFVSVLTINMIHITFRGGLNIYILFKCAYLHVVICWTKISSFYIVYANSKGLDHVLLRMDLIWGLPVLFVCWGLYVFAAFSDRELFFFLCRAKLALVHELK